MSEELPKLIPVSTEVNIALLQKDVSGILKTLEKIDIRTEAYEKTFARKEELQALERNIEKHYQEIKTELVKKVDHTDFDPIKTTLGRINWIVISSIVIGLLGLVIKAGTIE